MKTGRYARNAEAGSATTASTMNMMLQTPWNACDRRCERCPLSADCKLYATGLDARERAAARGLDPERPEVALQLVGESLAKALELAALEAQKLGITIDHAEPLPQAPDAGRLFAEAGREYRDAAFEATTGPTTNALMSEARFVAFLVGAKTARIKFDLPLCADDVARDHTAFNLLLIDTLLRQSRALFTMALGELEGPERLERAGAILRRPV